MVVWRRISSSLGWRSLRYMCLNDDHGGGFSGISVNSVANFANRKPTLSVQIWNWISPFRWESAFASFPLSAFYWKIWEWSNFLKSIWWSDEVNFQLHAVPNRKNARFWTDDRCEVSIIEKPTSLKSVTVFAAFSVNRLMHLFFF